MTHMHAEQYDYEYHQQHGHGYGHDAGEAGRFGGYERQMYAGFASCHPDEGMAYGTSPTGVAPTCAVCALQRVDMFGAVCSRRCGWVANGCCPQCGRFRSSSAYFCSQGCAAEARQANWCVGCGVRQLQHGAPTCGAPPCVALYQRVASYAQQQFRPQHVSPASSGTPTSQRPGTAPRSSKPALEAARAGRGRTEPHVRVGPTDKIAAGVKQQLGVEMAKRVVAIVKIGGPAEARKQYTAYRCRVEGEMNEANGIGAPKYGHGGEGNEQRRYVPLRSECGLASLDAAEGGDTVRTCGSPTCEACQLLENGIRATCHATAIPAFSSAMEAAARAPSAEPTVVAVAVCRVTLGSAKVLSSSDAESEAALPGPGPTEHSTVVKHVGFDVAYVATSLPTVDPQFILFVRV